MKAANIYGRGISFPPRIGGDGRLAWSEGEENVRESIRIILLTALNERLRRPTFGGGLGEFLFEPNTVMTRHSLAERITGVLTAWEPRITIQAVTVEPDTRDASAAVATVQYKLVATQVQERLSLNFTMAS
jgi:phage baseplate assembly protein W